MIVKNLRYSRESLDLKQIDLTNLLGVTSSTISGWETGKDTIPLKQLIKYANHFGFSLDYLFGLKEENEKYMPLEIDLKLIGKNLKHLREIAKIINTTSSGYAHYENARNLIPTSFLYNLSFIYKNFSIDETLGRKKNS